MQTLVLVEAPKLARSETELVERLRARPDVDVHTVPPGEWVLPDFAPYDAIVAFIPFMSLRNRTPIPWTDFSGFKAIYENDGFLDYTGWTGLDMCGWWTDLIPELGPDLLVVSGQASADHFERQGIRSAVVLKGCTPGDLHDLGGERHGVCHFGRLYPARRLMLREVRKAGLQIDQVEVPYLELNARLNQYLVNVVCNLQAHPRFGKVSRAANRRIPCALHTIHPGPEPMIKNFEAALSGCAVFMDEVADLAPAGFVDGETAVIYTDLDELIDKLRHWLDRPDDLRRIGRAGAALTLERHTWSHRADELMALVEREVQGRATAR